MLIFNMKEFSYQYKFLSTLNSTRSQIDLLLIKDKELKAQLLSRHHQLYLFSYDFYCISRQLACSAQGGKLLNL